MSHHHVLVEGAAGTAVAGFLRSREEVHAVLSDEQKTQLDELRARRHDGGGGNH